MEVITFEAAGAGVQKLAADHHELQVSSKSNSKDKGTPMPFH